MTPARSWVFRAILVAFVVGCIWWSVHIPYAPDQLYRAVPANVTVVSAHYDLAGRWSMLTSNPVSATLLSSFGLDQQALRELNADEKFKRWFRRLASDESVVAYAPDLGIAGRPSWVFASWIGGSSQRLRWLLSTSGKLKPIDRVHYPVWVIRPSGMKNASKVAFAFVEGMVVGCVGNDVTVMDDILRCVDGLYPSIAAQRDLIPARVEGVDRGWFGVDRRVTYAFDAITATTIRGHVTAPFSLHAGQPDPSTATLEKLQQLWGDYPVAYAVVDRAAAASWLTNTYAYAWVRAVTNIVAEAQGGSIALGVLAGDFSGRFKGLKLPTIMAGASVQDPEKARKSIAEQIDNLNARSQWGLVPQELMVGAHRVYAIEGTAQNLYAGLAVNERVAYTTGEDWLLFSSNVEGLTNLLAAADRRGPAGVASREIPAAPVQGLIDLEQGAKAIRLAITAYSFKLALEDPFGSQPERQKLNEVKAWVDALAPLKTVRFWLRPEGDVTRLSFDAGAE
ncbi:MAG: hypothetical protein V1929_13110 [bacterium]